MMQVGTLFDQLISESLLSASSAMAELYAVKVLFRVYELASEH